MHAKQPIGKLIHTATLTLLLAVPANAAWIVSEVPMQAGWSGDAESSDINSSGVVCGFSETAAGYRTAFRYDGNMVTELPNLTPAHPTSLAWGINAHDVVCGNSYRADGKERAVYWEGTTLHTVPYAADANTNSYCWANDINDAGVIVGFFWNTNGVRTAYYYKDGVSHSLDSAIRAIGLTDGQTAKSINNRNIICGSAHDGTTSATTSYTYDIGTGVATLIGRIGAADCSATDINEHGQTLGRSSPDSTLPWPENTYYRAVTYDGSWHFGDSAELASQRVGGINDGGRIVAYSGGTSTRKSWYSDGAGLNSRVYITLPGWTTLNVQEVNNNDWIAGYGRTTSSGTDERAFIIVPPPGDKDHDGDIDLDDFAEFVECLSGPKQAAGFAAPTNRCLDAFDFGPADGDIDLEDAAAFQMAFEGN